MSILSEALQRYAEAAPKDPAYSLWKRRNVSLRGMKSLGVPNKVSASFGKGLYTVPLSNRSMAAQYGSVYFVVNGIPKNPKTVQGMNSAEIYRYNLIDSYCKHHGKEYDIGFFGSVTDMSTEMVKLGFDGFVIKGREMVNYTPTNIKYFKNESDLVQYYIATIKDTL